MIETLTVAELAYRCGEETSRYLRRETYAERFCLELFRRAVVQRDEEAWAAVYGQYSAAVRRWLRTRPDEEEEGVVMAFERFWRAVDARKFAGFTSLGAVLQYLKLCAVTAQMDRARAARTVATVEPLDEATHDLPGHEDVEAEVAAGVDATHFWRTVQEALHDEREQLVVYLSYVIGLSPRAICARHGAEFPDVTEVYRLKRIVLDRLRRTPQLRDVSS